MLQVCENVIDVFRTDGQADGVGLDALIQQLFFRQLAVGGGCRMDYQAFYVRYIGKEGENLQAVDKLVGFLHAAFDFNGKDGAAAIGEVFFIQPMIRVIRQAGMVHLFHLGVVPQKIHHLLGIFCMTLQAKRKGFRALQQQECCEGRDTGAGIPEQHCPDIGDKGSSSRSLHKGYTMITGIGL